MQRPSTSRLIACVLAVVAVGVISTTAASAHGRDDNRGNGNAYQNHDQGDHHRGEHHRGEHHRRHHPRPPADPGYAVTPLVSDQAGDAPHTDTHLVNGWGLVAGPTTPWWVANQGTNSSTLYDGTGLPQALVVGVPGGPTGTVFNGGTGFTVPVAGKPVASRFIFATLAGTIQGWPSPPPAAASSTTAIDNSPSHAVYTGLAISADYSTLYAADFANGKVDMWDSTWAPITTPGAFVDPFLTPSSHYAPFGIQTLGGSVYVTYAKQPDTPGPEVHGHGLGLVDQFSPTGVFLHRVAALGNLNAPWGLALAPASFGSKSDDLLVGNFGDGQINAFKLQPWGQWVTDDQLRDSYGTPVVIDGLWGLSFGNGTPTAPTTSLYFAAGPDQGTHGLFGTVTANQNG
jgi:uncharacterized protein (TIGR03118 family)